jgi:ketosteroid isomerase-like protein
MTPQDFVRAYEAVLATQDWSQVEPLMHPDVCVTFSTGARHRGIADVERAYRDNFDGIQDERYAISDVHWVSCDAMYAVYLFQFRWSGRIGDQFAGGSGLGTSVIKCEDGRWRLLAEHLGPGAT